MSKVQIYTDGSAQSSPDGPGGYGTVPHFTGSKGQLHEKIIPDGHARTASNRMELMATIMGLEALNRSCGVQLCSDPRYLTDAFNQRWIDSWIAKGWSRGKSGSVKNIDPWRRLLETKELHCTGLIWVKGHAGYPQNKRCDQLVTSTADGSGLMIDEGLEN